MLYHPETKLKDYGIEGLKNTLEIFKKIDDLYLMIIYPNADTYNDKMIKIILANKSNNIKIIKSSSHRFYFPFKIFRIYYWKLFFWNN